MSNLLNISVSTESNIENLVILICNLLIGGNFQVIHSFSDSGGLNNHRFHDMECLNQVPWIRSDINPNATYWNDLQRNHHVLELTFLDSRAIERSARLQKHSNHHRLFILVTANNDSKLISEMATLEMTSTQGSLLLIHDTMNGNTKVYSVMQPMDPNPIYIQSDSGLGQPIILYEKTFGKFDKMWLTGVEFQNDVQCLSYNVGKGMLIDRLNQLLTNLFYSRMNFDFVRETQWRCNRPATPSHQSYVRHVMPSIYKEFSFSSEPVNQLIV